MNTDRLFLVFFISISSQLLENGNPIFPCLTAILEKLIYKRGVLKIVMGSSKTIRVISNYNLIFSLCFWSCSGDWEADIFMSDGHLAGVDIRGEFSQLL